MTAECDYNGLRTTNGPWTIAIAYHHHTDTGHSESRFASLCVFSRWLLLLVNYSMIHGRSICDDCICPRYLYIGVFVCFDSFILFYYSTIFGRCSRFGMVSHFVWWINVWTTLCGWSTHTILFWNWILLLLCHINACGNDCCRVQSFNCKLFLKQPLNHDATFLLHVHI